MPFSLRRMSGHVCIDAAAALYLVYEGVTEVRNVRRVAASRTRCERVLLLLGIER